MFLKFFRIITELLVSYALNTAYIPFCLFVFSIVDLNTRAKFYFTPFFEEFFRFVSVFMGGIIQYAYTLFFSLSEFYDFIRWYKITVNNNVPLEFYFVRFLAVLIHFILLFVQIFLFKEYLKTKKVFYLINGYLFAVMLHLIYNFYLAKHVARFFSIGIGG